MIQLSLNSSNNGDDAYKEGLRNLTVWCNTNNLVINTKKTKEINMDFRTTKKVNHSPVSIKAEDVERVSSFKFLAVTITEDISWADNTSVVGRKAQHYLYSLRRLKIINLFQKLLVNF